jgi:hypothetical protein
VTLVNIQDARINESSGICASRGLDGVYYTHNDSGDTARFFKFNRKGEVLGVYNVTNAKPAVDWEDIASATVGGKAYIFCGDIGDNRGSRKEIYVYRIPEPATAGSVSADRVYTLTYPDGAHNAETLMVDPKSGDIEIVTKASHKPSEVFVLRTPGPTGSYMLKRVGALQVGSVSPFETLVTGGDISHDSLHVLLRTYSAAWEYDVPVRFDDWIKAKPRRVQTNADRQGEGICYSRDGKSLLTTSEGTPCQVSEARLSASKE